MFGARGTGKTSLLKETFANTKTLWIDLLRGQSELQYSEDPDSLSSIIDKQVPEWVIIDEVQKIPKLLDIVHLEIERRNTKFALTGSSARKLKRGAANLLAGRAFVYQLYPFTHLELGDAFDLALALQWGALPRILSCSSDEERTLFLESYVESYLKEEIFQEQLTRKIIPFRKFLKIAAQANGTIVNFSNIAKDIAIDSNTVKTYFDILEDTLVGFYLPATDTSFRKQQIKSPKFYLFDTGVKRAIEGVSHLPIISAQEFGINFEHWLITELYKLNSYTRGGYEFSYLRIRGGLEIDLILRKPREKDIFIEIKSTSRVRSEHLAHLVSVKREHPSARCICLSQEVEARIIDGVEVLPWQMGFGELGLVF
jgi:predicted AAA+ superfamily ATPase